MISVASAATYFDSFQVTFSNEKPADMKIFSYQCDSSGCSSASPANVEYYKGDAIQCWFDYGQNGDSTNYLNCMENYKLSGNTLNLNDCSTIADGCSGDVFLFAKYETSNAPHGFINYFSTRGDSYFPQFARQDRFSCENDICVDTYPALLQFVKGLNAVAEVGQVNIMNVDNELLPVQVQVPVSIEETVCSAYRFANNYFRPQIPAGYSDFSANTQVDLRITQQSTGQNLYSETITIPIEADTCAGLAAFSWTPSASLQDEAVSFRVETDVIDNQVVSSTRDFAEVIETVYPENLDGTCWTRAYDFTLSNVPSTEMTTSVAQITAGESLYAVFDAGAWRDETITPMGYTATVYFDGQEVYNRVFASGADVQTQVVDLTNEITGLSPGQYEVKLVTQPDGSGCSVAAPVEQTQNLQILAPETFRVTFNVKDAQANLLDGANVNLHLNSADDYYVTTPNYDSNVVTDANGNAVFTDAIRGDYTYTVTKDGYTTVSNDIHVGSDMNVYVTLPAGNTAPQVALPEEFTSFYQDSVEFDLREYVTDFNDDFRTLTIDVTASSSINVQRNGNMVTLTTTAPVTGTVTVTATDASGSTGTDSAAVNFIDNQAPVVNLFEADPNSGAAPFMTTFNVDVTDADGDALTCTIDYFDGTAERGDCADANGVMHSFANPGTYNVRLTVEDGVNEPVEVIEQVFVFERENMTPHIEYFTLSSSNGFNLPTDLTFDWNVSHPDPNANMQCSIRINGATHPVTCDANTYMLNNYTQEGLGKFTFIAYDGTHQVMRSIERFFILDNAMPIIDSFTATPSVGTVNLTTSFDVAVRDLENDPLTCTITFGDGTSTTSSCNTFNGTTHTYTSEGSYIATLEVTDGYNNVFASHNIRVFSEEDGSPMIDYFTLDSSNGNVLPTDLTLDWSVSHPLGLPMVCTLTVNGNTTPVACEGPRLIFDYNTSGAGVFTLDVIDESNNTVNQTITRIFGFPGELDLETKDLGLIIDDEIAPGEFSFNLVVFNETLARRSLTLMPTINCEGVDNTLSGEKTMSSRAISQDDNVPFTYRFTLDTADFELRVPTDKVCTFKLRVTDSYGTNVLLSDNVVFTYPQEVSKYSSIRGNEVDILNYMETSLITGINKGYNTIQFTIENNQPQSKDISLTMISGQLGIDYSMNEKLGPGRSIDVQIPIYVQESTRSGMYPVRIGVSDDEEKQVRYSYIKVN